MGGGAWGGRGGGWGGGVGGGGLDSKNCRRRDQISPITTPPLGVEKSKHLKIVSKGLSMEREHLAGFDPNGPGGVQH